jgi:hypothetical protein
VETADFVADAMGRASRLGDLIEQGGWDRPSMTRVTININYATAWFRRADRRPGTAAALALCSADLRRPRGSVVHGRGGRPVDGDDGRFRRVPA